jgi:hypothetical protein
MAFVVGHRVSGVSWMHGGQSVLRAARLLTSKLCAPRHMTPQERANLYVSRTPIGVLVTSPAAPGGR